MLLTCLTIYYNSRMANLKLGNTPMIALWYLSLLFSVLLIGKNQGLSLFLAFCILAGIIILSVHQSDNYDHSKVVLCVAPFSAFMLLLLVANMW